MLDSSIGLLKRSSWMACALAACCVFTAFAEEDVALAKLQPALRADLSADGLITWWLVSPPSVKIPAPAKTPFDARETAATKEFAGWTLDVAENFYNNFGPLLKDGARGSLYASARVHSAVGGSRVLYFKTYCALKVYLDGKIVMEKPQPERMAEFNTTVTLPKGVSEITIELVPRGEQCMIQCLLLDGKNPGPQSRPAPGDSLAYPLSGAPGIQDAAALKNFPRSLALTPKDSFVKPGDKTSIALVTAGSIARGIGTVMARLAPAAENGVTGDHREHPLPPGGKTMFDLQIPADVRNVYEVKIEFLSDNKVFGTKSISLLCLDGFLKEATDLEREVATRAAKNSLTFPNTRLAIEKIKLFVESERNGGDPRAPNPADEMQELVASARSFLLIEDKNGDPFADKPGYMERGYTSTIDGGVQPYICSVPESAFDRQTKTKKFPLVIFLHGYDPTINKHRWWEARDYAAVCARHDCFLAIPFGRSNTDFQSCGEIDVLDVIAEMRKNYPCIDADRIYLCGYSMGGMGVYTIAAHYPDMFAGGMVLAGRADNPLQNYSAMENFHPFKQHLMHADNPISLCENLINFPLRIYHGVDDPVVPKTQAMRMNARFKALGADAKLILKPGGHNFGFEVLVEDEPLQWLLSHRRAAQPAKRQLKTYSLAFAKQGGVEVSTFAGGLDPIELAWTGDGDKAKIQKESPNITAKSVNGVPPVATDFKKLKIPALCGPVRQAICTPFTIVYGTKGTAAANALNKENAEKFATWWFDFTRSRIVAKADVDVTAEEKQSRNLFLFGEEQDNSLHAAASASLPVSVKNGAVTIGGKKVSLTENGIMYCYPSPFAAADKPRAVIICAGVQYGDKIGANHKLDLIPDLLLYSADIDTDGTSTNKPLCAAFFDGAWKLSDKTTWWFDK